MSDSKYIRKSGRSLERMPSSRNGNPRYMVGFADGTSYPTAVDASVGYGIGNREYAGEVEILLNGRNQIVDIREVTA